MFSGYTEKESIMISKTPRSTTKKKCKCDLNVLIHYIYIKLLYLSWFELTKNVNKDFKIDLHTDP